MLSPAEWSAVRLTAELALWSTVLLLIVGTPLAWWLARTRSRVKPLAAALTAMPRDPSSRAHAFIIVNTAPLLVAYAPRAT